MFCFSIFYPMCFLCSFIFSGIFIFFHFSLWKKMCFPSSLYFYYFQHLIHSFSFLVSNLLFFLNPADFLFWSECSVHTWTVIFLYSFLIFFRKILVQFALIAHAFLKSTRCSNLGIRRGIIWAKFFILNQKLMIAL